MSGPVIRLVETSGILTRSNLPVCEFSVNPYTGCTHGCMYCYASFMKRFSGHTEPWGDFLDVKYWKPVRSPARYSGREILIGSVTDPYNPQEAVYGRTRAFLEEMCGSGARISIATKSDLVLRDLELIKSFPDARVSWSINTLDEEFRSAMDRASAIEARIEAMRIFHEAGVRTTCFISPIFPGITDVKAIIRKTAGYCNLIWLENLNLRGGFRMQIMEFIKREHPGLLPLYEEIYMHGDLSYWENLDMEMQIFAKSLGLEYLTNDDTMHRPFAAPPVIVNYFYHERIKKSARRCADA